MFVFSRTCSQWETCTTSSVLPAPAGPQGKLLVIKVLLLIKHRSKALTLREHMWSSRRNHPLRLSQFLSLERKQLMACGHTRSLGDPKRKVWWVQQQVFPSVRNQGLIRLVGERNHFWRLLMADVGRAHYQVQQQCGICTQHNQATLPQRNSEVVNLTGLAENKGLDV